MATTNAELTAVRPVRDGLLVGSLSNLDCVHLAGSRCEQCGETTLGVSSLCPNCGGGSLRILTLSDEGTIWTFTVVRHRPPGDYRGPDPFVPFALGLVELPDGLRVMAPIWGDPGSISIGMPVRFKAKLRLDATVDFLYEPVR